MNQTEAPRLKIFFIVEPGPLEVQAHLLIASLRLNCRDDFTLQAFCRAERISGLQAETRQFLEDNAVSLSPVVNDFPDGYPAGNKLLAAAAVTGADWFLFLDTDMVMLRPASIMDEAVAGRVAMCLDTINAWTDQADQWRLLFNTFDLPVPEEIVHYPHGNTGPPIFNAGLLLFPAPGEDGVHFGQQWLQNARTLDAIPTLTKKRPWLDTISLLPTLNQRAAWGPLRLPRTWNNTSSLATEDAIILHYHGLRQLKQYGWLERADAVLQAAASPHDSVFGLAWHYSRTLGVAGDVFRRAMRHGLQTQSAPV